MSLPFIPYSKETQLHRIRQKRTAKQRGSVTTAVRLQLQERSNSRCERCGRSGVALQAAHLIRRWKVEGSTTVNDLVSLCVDCHIWADTSREGRDWLEEFRNRLVDQVSK